MKLFALVVIAASLSAVGMSASVRVARDNNVCPENSHELGEITEVNTEMMAMHTPRQSCSDWKETVSGASGVYTISPTGGCEMKVFCDMCLDDEMGWIVVQRRINESETFHDKNWEQYKQGFGDYRTNYWIGLEKLHMLTSETDATYELYIGMRGTGVYDDNYYIRYSEFSVGSETNKYKLSVSGSDNNALDSLQDYNNEMFTTWDEDNDHVTAINCAQPGGSDSGTRGGWWFGIEGQNCGATNLNGVYNGNGFRWVDISRQSNIRRSIMAIRKST